MRNLCVFAIAALAALAAGCRAVQSNDDYLRTHPPARFPSGDGSSYPGSGGPPPPGGNSKPNPSGDIFVPGHGGDHPDWRVKEPRRWTHIIIHHSATESGSAGSFDAYHKNIRKWSGGLGYDFVIGNGNGAGDGQVEAGPRWKKQLVGAHAGSSYYNEYGIGICLVGNFEIGRPTEKQLAALVELIRWLQKEYHISGANVKGHCNIKDTLCPGKNFPMARVKKAILP